MARTGGKSARATTATTKGNNNPATAAPGAKVKGAGAGASSASKKKKKPKKKAKADPVSVATGAVIDSRTDLALPGAISLRFERTYSSFDAGTKTPLGRSGWTHGYHQFVEVDAGELVHTGPQLTETRYPRVARLEEAFDRGSRTVLRPLMDGVFEIHSLDDRLTREFAPPMPGGKSMLRAIRDAWGNQILFVYDGEQLAQIVDTCGREIDVARDARGRIVALEVRVERKLLKTVRYKYSDEGDLVAFVDALGQATRYVYDGKHRMVKKTVPTDLSFYYQYDPDSGRCVMSRGDGNLHKVEFTYDTAAKTTTTHGEREPRVFQWDDRGQILSEATFDGQYVEKYEYDEDGLCIAQEDAEGHRIESSFDARGNLTKAVDAAGNVTVHEYKGDHRVRTVRPGGLEELFSYDEKGALSGVRYPNGQTFAFDRDLYGHISALYFAGTAITRQDWGAQHLVVRQIDARGAEVRKVHDALGRLVERTDPFGAVTRVTYDADDQIVVVAWPDGTRDEYTYDALGNVVQLAQSDGKVLRSRYVGHSLVEQIYPDGSVWRFEYDRMEHLLAVVNPKTERYEYRYDRAGRIIEETTFDGRVLKYKYSRGNRLSRIEYPDATWRQFTYDALGHLTEEDTTDGPATFKRDPLGHLLECTIEDGPLAFTTKFELDPFGRTLAETQGDQTIRYTYDDRHGRTSSRTMPNGQTTRYGYDVLSTTVEIEHEGQRVYMERDVVGKEVRRSLFGGAVTIDSTWDVNERVTSRVVSAPQPGGALPKILSQRSWRFTPTGALVAEQDAAQGNSTFEHDVHRDLVAMTTNHGAERFRYDPAGALREALSTLSGGGAWDVGRGNILLRTPTHQYGYDENHRRTKKVDLATGKTTEYEWDCRQRLRRVKLPDGRVATYFYDALGRRVRKEVETPGADELRIVRFLWDGHFLIGEQDSTRAERVFVHDPRSFEVVLQSEGNASYAHVIDPSGKTRELVDRTGKIVWEPTYSAWGKVLSAQTVPTSGATVDSPFRLLGHYWDEESGLSSALYRYFDPDTGRWLSADPLGISGGVTLFGYDGSPATDGDPLGLDFDGQKYNSDGSLTPDYYAYLRARTPTDGLRQDVNDDGDTNSRGQPLDPITGKPVTRLEADHIVPMKEITEMDGFNQLSTAEQLELLNCEGNFWGLGRSTNGSKSDQNHDEWTTFKGEELSKQNLKLLAKVDKAARAALAKKLKALLAKKGLCV